VKGQPQETWWRLAAMMALVYAIQGSFWPLLAIHLQDLGLDGRSRGWIFGTMAMGAGLVPLCAGQLADRLMPAQYVLALAYALAAALLALLGSGCVVRESSLFALFLVYWMIVAPTYSLCGSLAMRHLEDPERQFGRVRLWGTLGWIVAGWVVSLVMAATGANRAGSGACEAFLVASLLSVVFAAFSLTLPDTPPLAHGASTRGSVIELLTLLRNRDVRAFLVTSFGVSLTTPMVYQVIPGYLQARGLPKAWVSTAMTLGQWPEIATLALLPWLVRRLGTKTMLIVGITAWLMRFLSLLARPSLAVAVGGGVLHGVGFGCLTVGGQVFLDRCAPVRQRASVQGLFVVLTLGLGSLLGNVMAGELATRTSGDDLVFLMPCVINGLMLAYFAIGFPSRISAPDQAGSASTEPFPQSRAVGEIVGCTRRLVTKSADG
jgi:MFS family permease